MLLWMYHSAAMNENVRYDVAVIGAGPAGMVSATTCAQAGASVILLERDAWAGGKLGIQSQPLQGPVTIFGGLNGFEHQARLMNEASDAGVVVRLGVEVDQLSPPAVSGDSFRLTVEGMLDSEGLVSARSVILATGSEEPEPDFPGSNLHGVMRSGAAQVALNVRAQLVGRRIVMAGSGNSGLLIAQNLLDAGAEIVAVLEKDSKVEGREVNASPLRQAGVEVLTSTPLIEAVGDGKLERVRVQQLEYSGVATRDIEADTLCVAWPREPDSHLAVDAGCPTLEIEILGGIMPIHDLNFVTLVNGLFVCGDTSGVESGATAIESGRLAGLAASRFLGFSHEDTKTLSSMARRRLGYLRRGRRGGLRREAKVTLASVHRRLTGNLDAE